MNVCTYLNFIYWKLYPYATFKVREGSGANDGIAFRFEYCYKFVLTEFHVPLQMYINARIINCMAAAEFCCMEGFAHGCVVWVSSLA